MIIIVLGRLICIIDASFEDGSCRGIMRKQTKKRVDQIRRLTLPHAQCLRSQAFLALLRIRQSSLRAPVVWEKFELLLTLPDEVHIAIDSFL